MNLSLCPICGKLSEEEQTALFSSLDYSTRSFKKGDWVVDNWNEAIYELKSPDYNDKDEFTPMVEKYFGYNASSFDFVPSKTK